MTANIIERSLLSESLEVRESPEGRRVCGIAAPFGRDYDAGDYVEQFSRGAFAVSIRDRGDQIPLLEAHRQDAMPLGRAIHLEERSDGLYAEFLISRTGRGDEALQLARDGVMHSFSVGFVPVRDKRRTTADGRPLVVRDEVKLHHVGLISEVPAYDDAKVLAVRDYDPDDEQAAPRLSVWRARLYIA
jgi:HK97 family phage prohead protease